RGQAGGYLLRPRGQAGFAPSYPYLRSTPFGRCKGRNGLRRFPEMLLVLRELREDLVSTFALTQGADHRRGRRKQRDDEGHDEDDRREDHARHRESNQDGGDDGWRQEERDEHPGDWDE